MGKIRPSSSSGSNKTSSKTQGSKNSSAVKKAKTKETFSLDESVALSPPLHQGLEALIHPLGLKEFLDSYWSVNQACHLSREQKHFNASLFASLVSRSSLTSLLSNESNPAYYHTDLQLIGYDEDDDIRFETPIEGGKVDMSFVWKQIGESSSQSSLHLSNVDIFCPEVKKMLDDIDRIWKGDGASTSMLTVTKPGNSPFPPHADAQDCFLVQINGVQEVELCYANPGVDLKSVAEDEIFPYFLHGPDPELVFPKSIFDSCYSSKILLKPGSTLFIPKNVDVKFMKVPADSDTDSIALNIYLSKQPGWKATFESILEMALAHIKEGPSDASFSTELITIAGNSKADHEGRTPVMSRTGGLLKQHQDDRQVHSDNEEEGGEGNEEEGEDGEDEIHEKGLESFSVFPHDLKEDKSGCLSALNPTDRLQNVLLSVFNKAAEITPEYIKSLSSTVHLTRSSFLDCIPHIQEKIGGSTGLEEMLEKNGGIVKISNFLPKDVAEAIHTVVNNVADHDWQTAYANEDPSANNIDHVFEAAKTFSCHHAIFALFKRILPHLVSDFSLGKYVESHFIDTHDDRQYKFINGAQYSRHIALVYYASKDWKAEYGGQFVDIDDNSKEYVPEFNSLIAFKVPRWHQVKPVVAEDVKRFSVFGWFLLPGKSYELYTGEDEQGEESDEAEMAFF